MSLIIDAKANFLLTHAAQEIKRNRLLNNDVYVLFRTFNNKF